jgi:hypothetical protein
MNLLSHFRSRERRLGRFMVSAFLVVWLNMALQPCLMAAAPLVGEAMGDCPHCPEPATHCDDVSASRCTWVDGYDYDGRQASADPEPTAGVLLPVAGLAFEPRFSARPLMPRPPPEPPPPNIALHLVHCVQLN